MSDTKIVKTINSERKVKSSINPKALIQSSNVISSTQVSIRDRPLAVKNQDISNMAVWDNPATTWDGVDTNDRWDSYNTSNIVFSRVVNKNNLFVENFDYEAFNISGTATWDTTNQQLTFTSGQNQVIGPAFKDSSNTQTVVAATLNVTISSGSFDLEMSADGGSNWESVTNGSSHTFTNTGSDLRIRITENNSSTGTITLVRCSYTI